MHRESVRKQGPRAPQFLLVVYIRNSEKKFISSKILAKKRKSRKPLSNWDLITREEEYHGSFGEMKINFCSI